MAGNSERLKVVALEDGSSAVVKVDPENPRLLEVVATFYDAARAHHYANITSIEKPEPVARITKKAEEQARPHDGNTEKNGASLELSPRQSAVLNALRAKMDDHNKVEAKAATIAEAAQIPLGSLHSVLTSLEKKHLIRSARPGTPRAPAVYQVL